LYARSLYDRFPLLPKKHMAIHERQASQIFSSLLGPDFSLRPPVAAEPAKLETTAENPREVLKGRRLGEIGYTKSGLVKEALEDIADVLRQRGFDARVVVNYKEKGDPDFRGKKDQDSDLDRPEFKIDKPYELGVAFGIPGDVSKDGTRYGAQVTVVVTRDRESGEIVGLQHAGGTIIQPPGDPNITPDKYTEFASSFAVAATPFLTRMHSRVQAQTPQIEKITQVAVAEESASSDEDKKVQAIKEATAEALENARQHAQLRIIRQGPQLGKVSGPEISLVVNLPNELKKWIDQFPGDVGQMLVFRVLAAQGRLEKIPYSLPMGHFFDKLTDEQKARIPEFLAMLDKLDLQPGTPINTPDKDRAQS